MRQARPRRDTLWQVPAYLAWEFLYQIFAWQRTVSPANLSWIRSWIPFKLAEGVTTPTAPLLATTLGASATMVGGMEFLFSVAMMLGAFVWGRTSDELNKRKAVLVTAFALASISIVGLALAPTFELYVLSRATMGFAIAGIPAVGGALIAECVSEDRLGSGLGKLNATGAIGYTLGLVAAVILATDVLGWSLPHLLLAAGLVGLGSCLLILFFLDEPGPLLGLQDLKCLARNAVVPVACSLKGLGRPCLPSRQTTSRTQRRAWAYLSATALHFLATGAVMVMLPLYLSKLGASSSIVFAAFLVHAAISAIAFSPSGAAADRFGFRRSQLSALAVRACAFGALAVPLVDSALEIGIVLAVVGATFAVLVATGPAALLRFMAIRGRGELTGLYKTASAFGMAVGALCAGVVVQVFGFQSLFMLGATLTVVSAAVTGSVFPATRDGQPTAPRQDRGWSTAPPRIHRPPVPGLGDMA